MFFFLAEYTLDEIIKNCYTEDSLSENSSSIVSYKNYYKNWKNGEKSESSRRRMWFRGCQTVRFHAEF